MTVQVGVESGVKTGLSDKGLDRAQLGKAIGEGLQRGITQVAIESAAQKAGVDPLTSALTARAVTGALDGLLGTPGNAGDKTVGAMKGIFDAYTNSTLNTLSLGGTPEAGNPYSQAVYASKVKDFGDIVRQRGLSQALETYATGIFMRDSLDSIVRSGDEFGKQVQEKLKKKGEYKKVPLKDGTTGKVVDLPATRLTNIDKAKSAAVAKAIEDEALRNAIEGVDYALIFDAQDNLMGIKEGGRYRQGKFGTLPGTDKVVLTEGTDTQALDDKAVTRTGVTAAKPTHISVLTPEQEDLLKPVKYHTPLTLRPADDGTPIKFNEKGEITDGTLEGADYKITLRDGIIQEERRRLSLLNGNEVISQDIFLQTRRNSDGKQQDKVEVTIPQILDPTKIKGPVKSFEEFKQKVQEIKFDSQYKETAEQALRTMEQSIKETGIVPDIYFTEVSIPERILDTGKISIVRERKSSLFFKGMKGSNARLEVNPFTGEVTGATVKIRLSNPSEAFRVKGPKHTQEVIFPIEPKGTGILPTVGGGVDFKTTFDGQFVSSTTLTGELLRDSNLDGKRTFTFEQKGISERTGDGLLAGAKYTVTMDNETYREVATFGVAAAITLGVAGLTTLGVPARVVTSLGTLKGISTGTQEVVKAAAAVEAARVVIGAIKIEEEKEQIN